MEDEVINDHHFLWMFTISWITDSVTDKWQQKKGSCFPDYFSDFYQKNWTIRAHDLILNSAEILTQVCPKQE